MLLSTVAKYLHLTVLIKKKVIAAAMNYRASFLIQVIGMFFNDGMWLMLWYLFFKSFPAVNGWSFQQMIVLNAFSAVLFALCEIPCEGLTEFSRYVITGQLDTYLTTPKNMLWQLAMSKTDISALGDGFFGITLMFFAYGMAPLSIAWFLLVSLLSAILFTDFIVIIQSSAFWFGDIEDAAKRVIHMVLGFTVYPQSIFSGALKILMMTVMPAFFIITVPVTLLVDFSWSFLGILISSVLVGTALALFIFKKGLSRYESGSAMTGL